MNMKTTSAKPLIKRSAARLVVMTLAAIGSALAAAPIAAAERLTQVRMSIDEDPIVLRLANSLGYFKQEGIEIVPVYFDKKDRSAQIKFIRDTLPTYAKGDYSFSPAAVKLVVDAIQASAFDSSQEGQWRATGENSKVKIDQLYDNRFVRKAMREL